MATKTKRTKKTTTKKATKKAAPKATAPIRDDLKRLQAAYSHILSIAHTNDKGKALRVVIGCTADYDDVNCAETREIATQDAFQVSRCAPCQREFSKRRRRKNPDA